ncbi:MAG TPA: hypothetical protein VHM72_02010 [Solirubrobacteraceae bacterium]|nr:hypothetical protein [Solirubrobacteraceae bacterium]
MSVDGTWQITAQTPIGEQQSTVELSESNGALTGRMTAPEDAAIYDGSVNGDEASWRVDITKPMSLKLHVSATIEGDAMSGKIKAGIFPAAPFTAQRTS